MSGRDESAAAPAGGIARTGPIAPTAHRRSPVVFDANPATTEVRDGWTVALRYRHEEQHAGPLLVDLSHRRRWDYQDGSVATQRPMDLPVPREYGQVGVHGSLVINRMNRTQVAIWHLGDDPAPTPPPETAFTEITDGHCMLAFVGPEVPAVLEHLTSLDLFDPARATPFLTQGPVLHVPCQIVTFSSDLVIMTLARGYGEMFAHAALHSGALAGLRPGGEDAFKRAFARATATSACG